MANEVMISKRWERGTRYYEAHLMVDLFGGWVVARNWGAIGGLGGRRQTVPVADYRAGIESMEAIRVKRQNRNYTSVP